MYLQPCCLMSVTKPKTLPGLCVHFNMCICLLKTAKGAVANLVVRKGIVMSVTRICLRVCVFVSMCLSENTWRCRFKPPGVQRERYHVLDQMKSLW